MLKRCMGVILSIAMILSTLGGMVVFADGEEAATSEVVKTFTLDTLTGSSAGDYVWNSAKAGGWDKAFPRNSGSYYYGDIEVKDKVYGKITDDNSVRLYKTKTVYDEMFYLDFTEPGSNNTEAQNTAQKTDAGKYYEMEVYMAWANGTADQKGVQGYYHTGKDGSGKCNDWTGFVIEVAADGTVKVFDSSTGIKLSSEKWYKFNLVAYAGDSTAGSESEKNWYKFYIDNKLVVDKKEFIPKGYDGSNYVNFNQFRGFKGYGLALISAKKDTITDGVWFDDFTVKNNLSTEPTYSEVKTTDDTGALVKKYMGNGYSGYVHKNAKTEDLKFGDNITAAYVTPDGTEATDFSAPKTYVRLTNRSGLKLFGVIESGNTLVYSKDFSDGNSVGSASVGTASVVGGMAGKSEEDKVMCISTDNSSSESVAWPSLQIRNDNHMSNAIDTTKPFTAEVSVRATGDYEKVNIQMGNDGAKTLAVIYPNGTIKRSDDSEVAATFEPGEWVRIGISVFPQINRYVLYINGQYGKDFTFDDAQKFTRLRYEQQVTAGKTAAFYLDDLRVYQGVEPTRLGMDLQSDEYGINKGGVIFVDDDTDLTDFYVDITNSNKIVGVYNDFKNNDVYDKIESGDVTEGNVVVAYNSDECIYKYYYVAIGQEAPLTVTSAVGGDGNATTWAKGDSTINLKLKCFKTVTTATVLVAEYDGTNLVKVTPHDITLNPTFPEGTRTSIGRPVSAETGTFTVNVEDTSHTIKAFIFDGMTNIMPLAGVTTLK